VSPFFFSLLCASPTLPTIPSRSPLLPTLTLLRPTARTSKTKLGLQRRRQRHSPLLRRHPLLRRRCDPEQKGSACIVPTSTRAHDFLTLTSTSHVRLSANSTLTHSHVFCCPAPSPLLRPIQPAHQPLPLRPTPPLSSCQWHQAHIWATRCVFFHP